MRLFRHFRPVYGGPEPRDVPRGVDVGVGRVAARTTGEQTLALTVGLLAVTALSALSFPD